MQFLVFLIYNHKKVTGVLEPHGNEDFKKARGSDWVASSPRTGVCQCGVEVIGTFQGFQNVFRW